jgi:hypothetical protein
MPEFVLTTHPWILAVVYAFLSVVNDTVVSHANAYAKQVIRASRNKDSADESPDSCAEASPYRSLPFIVLGVSLLLLCAYWDAIPHGVFLFVIGITVLMCSCNLLLHTIPSLFSWRLLHQTGYRGGLIDPSSQPMLLRMKVWYVGAAILFGLCWILTGSLTFCGAAVSSLNYAYGYSRQAACVNAADGKGAFGDSNEKG